jgi:hypothetical protein
MLDRGPQIGGAPARRVRNRDILRGLPHAIPFIADNLQLLPGAIGGLGAYAAYKGRQYVDRWSYEKSAQKSQRRAEENMAKRRRVYGPEPKPVAKKSKSQGRKRRHKVGAKPKIAKSLKGLRKQVQNIRKELETDRGVLIYRSRDTSEKTSSEGQKAVHGFTGIAGGTIQSALAQCRYYNPSDPANLVTADGETGTFSREFFIKRSYVSLTVRNNYEVPVRISLHVCLPKQATNTSALTHYTQGLTDVGNPSNVSPMVYLTDSKEFNLNWVVAKSKKKELQPGQKMFISHNNKAFDFDTADYDSHALSFQKKYGGSYLIMFMEGVLGHEEANVAQYNSIQAGVDCEIRRIVEVHYAAGSNIKYIYVDDGGDTFTTGTGNACVVMNSVNQTYAY